MSLKHSSAKLQKGIDHPGASNCNINIKPKWATQNYSFQDKCWATGKVEICRWSRKKAASQGRMSVVKDVGAELGHGRLVQALAHVHHAHWCRVAGRPRQRLTGCGQRRRRTAAWQAHAPVKAAEGLYITHNPVTLLISSAHRSLSA
jgi:hypothetical protein